jgi:hypothetical protein
MPGSVAAEVDKIEQQATGSVPGPAEVEGMNHRCSCTGGVAGSVMTGWVLLSSLHRTGSFGYYRNDMPGKMGQGYAAAAGDDSGPTSIALVGEGSLVCYQTGMMARHWAAAADIVAAEGWRM